MLVGVPVGLRDLISKTFWKILLTAKTGPSAPEFQVDGTLLSVSIKLYNNKLYDL